jgi:hypothetical protein
MGKGERLPVRKGEHENTYRSRRQRRSGRATPDRSTRRPGQGGANHSYLIRGFDDTSNPSNGVVQGDKSLRILFQNGPIKENGVNGITQEALLAIVAFAPNQVETAELLSKMTGTTTVQKASFTFSGSRFAPIMSHVNASVDHVERPLMTPDEIMRLKPPKKEGDGVAERITEPGTC